MTDTMSHFTSRTIPVLAALLVFAGASAQAASAAPGKKKERPNRLVSVKAPDRAGGAIRIQVRILRDLDHLSLKVNGRRPRISLPVTKRRHLKLHLDATKGVRFGRNRIVVRAFRGKRRQTVRRMTRVRTDAPLVGVRIPRHARQHDRVKLDARATRARGKGKLRYRWRIVAAPRRARARLTGSRHARPHLRGSHQGRYLLALTVSHRRPGGTRTSAAGGCPVTGSAKTPPSKPIDPPVSLPDGRPIASTPLAMLPDPGSNLTVTSPAPKPKRLPVDRVKARPRSAAGCTTQYVAVDMDPAIGPMGVAFDSRAQVGGQTGMRVGANFYPAPTGQAYAVFVDANTLEELGTTLVPPGQNAENWAELMSVSYVVDHQVLILLTGPGFTLVKGSTESDDTAISNEGLTEGAGGAPLAEGQIQGWLQPSIPIDSTDDSYRLISPDRAPVVSGQGSGQANTMTIGAEQYEATLPAGTDAGFHVVVTDPALRPILGTPAFFSTNTGDLQLDAQQQGALADLLSRANGTSASTVVMQSIGHPTATTSNSLAIGQQVERLGGSEWMFLSLNGQHGYSLIGNPPALGAATNAEPAAEATSQWTRHGKDYLEGLLKRRHDGAYQATLSDSVGGLDYSLQEISFQQPSLWPETDTAGKRAAGVWVAEQLGYPTEGPGLCYSTPRPDVRAQYCNDSLAIGSTQRKLAKLTYPEVPEFTVEDLTAVIGQFSTELDDVGNVRLAIANMQKPYLVTTGTTAVNADEVAVKVISSIPEPADYPLSAHLGLSSAVLYAASEIPAVGTVFGVAASALDIASDLTEQNGEPSPNWDIEVAAANAGTNIDARLQGTYVALESYEDILVSDAAKLADASNQAAGPWGQDSETLAEDLALLQLGVEQWLYTAIVPAAYDLVEIPGADPSNAGQQVHCIWSSAPEQWRPWLKADPRSLFFPLNDWAGNGPVPAQMMAMLHGGTGSTRSHSVGQVLADEMFGDPINGNAGLVAPWFYDRTGWTIKRPTMVQPSTNLKPGVCKVGYI